FLSRGATSCGGFSCTASTGPASIFCSTYSSVPRVRVKDLDGGFAGAGLVLVLPAAGFVFVFSSASSTGFPRMRYTPRTIIAATTPIAAGIRICRLLCRIATWSVWLVNGPPYSGDENVRVYDPIVEGAENVNVTVWLSPGEMVTGFVAFVSGSIPLAWRMRLTVITSVIFVELLFRWSVAVTEWSFAMVPIGSVVARRVVESVNAMVDKLFTRPIPVAALASRNTVMFLAPRRKSELIVAEKSPFGPVRITSDPERYLLGTREDPTYA